ncbi:hypothetical protein GFY24_00675 [Nocardia sp. SYP-A9097]|uniref:hypothetical protein n=1 Tax=Nocardia sp. SYP-A9097 TaxID=2663237 RepID=UPI00129AAEA0|nr:hypothetical protein [Nocardia sp. SYP-A9097]MRH85991.1 hypothetical protein [Nocardia sp. SYP-A9097]
MAICLTNPGRIMQLILRDNTAGSPTFGHDLIVLDLLGPRGGEQGIHLLEGSWDDLWHAPITQVRESWAYQEGSTLDDIPRVNERLCTLKLGTIGRTTRAWEEIDDLLWRVLGPGWDCYLRAFSEISEPRELRMRWEKAPKPLTQRDPGRTKALAWEVPTLSVDPYWYAPELSFAIKRSQMVEINPTTGAPQSGTGVWQGTIPMLNRADVECWPQYASNGLEADTVVWLPDGLSGNTVAVPAIGALGPGKEFLIRTYPLDETLLVRDDSQEWANMNGVAFESAIPAGTGSPVQVPIRIQGGTANTTITAYYSQRYTRFMGGEA